MVFPPRASRRTRAPLRHDGAPWPEDSTPGAQAAGEPQFAAKFRPGPVEGGLGRMLPDAGVPRL
eukprot:5877762-Alexandrium_andersonii.AAC.1